MSENVRIEWAPGELRDLLFSAEVQNLLQKIAEQGASAARAAAPVDTGNYKQSIKVLIASSPRRPLRKVAVTDRNKAKVWAIEARHGVLAKAKAAMIAKKG